MYIRSAVDSRRTRQPLASPRGQWAFDAVYALLLATCLLPAPAAAASVDSVSYAEEFARKIQAAQSIAPLGNNLFGDQTNWYNGQTSFEVTDVDLPGNSALPVRIVRTRSTSPPEGSLTPGLMADWEVDIPHLSGIFQQGMHWLPTNRCSAATHVGAVAPADAVNSDGAFSATEYWRGNFVHIPGQGSTHVLWRDPAYTAQPADGNTYRWVTANHAQLRCLSTLANGQPGEGFLAVTPEGTRYYFDWLIVRPYSKFTRPGSGSGDDVLEREEVRIYATRVEDRFGNWVTYTYSGERVTRIESNDGRLITIGYNAQNKITMVTAAARTWTYGYGTNGYLANVTLPDASSWSIATSQLIVTYYSQPAASSPCHLPPTDAIAAGQQTWTFTHPSGATGVFVFSVTRTTRTQIAMSQRCRYIAAESELIPGISDKSDAYSLISKTLSGPGLTAATWTAAYGGTSNNTKAVTQTHPDNTATRYTFGTEFYRNEGKVLRTEVLAASASVLSSTQTSYAINPASPPYAYRVGATGQAVEDAFGSTIVTATTNTTITQSGNTYSNIVNSFDSFARPASVTRSNSLGSSRTDTTLYHDDTDVWVLGQVRRLTNNDTALVESESIYDAVTALPEQIYAFGLLKETRSYYANGTLSTIADALSNTTSLSSWKRGLPQTITHPDSIAEFAVVNDSGWITSLTEGRGYVTGYGYDGMGRISSITYPAGDTVTWTTPTQAFTPVAATEYGLPAGHWRQSVTVGNRRKQVFFDALWRPVLTREYDYADATGTQRFVKRGFDHEGRETFASYASTSSTSTAGVYTDHDALGRVTARRTADAVTLEQRTYLAGNKLRITDADGRQSTITYQAFDEPTQDKAVRIDGPENQTTLINRDRFGKITSITQSGAWSGGTASATRSFGYDSYQRPCRRVDPESGSTVWGYDGAGRLAWEAKGQSGSGCLSSAPSGATTFGYDARSRKILDNYPGTTEDVSYGYDNANHLTSVANATATWIYTYNGRGLLETEQASLDGKTFTLNPTYNALADVTSVATPAQTLSFGPDVWGRPTQFGSWASGIAYHPNGLVSGYTLGSGLTYTQSLDSRLRPQTQDTRYGSVSIHKLTYGYSAASDLTGIDDQVDGSDDATFTYDDLHRLETAAGLWGSYGYVYDTLNNLRSRTGPAALTYSYNSSNRLSGITGGSTRSYGYNARGEITSDSGKTFTLTSLGQIASISGSTSATYGYDGNGRRIKTTKGATVEYTLYDRAGRLVYTESGTTKTDFLSLAGHTLVELRKVGNTTTPTYLHPDLLGSPRKATNAAGGILWQENYDPYGYKLNGVADKIGYTGHAYDSESAYTYMQARFYDAQVGRFLSTDPVHFVDDDPFTFNRYSYTKDSPYRFTDPSGRWVEDAVVGPLSITLGSRSFVNNLNGGNFLAATADGLGILFDIGAIALPGVPAAAGITITAVRGLSAVADVATAARGTTTVIGKVADLKGLAAGEQSLLSRLPNLGSPKANWAQNSGVLRQEMGLGRPIRDASVDASGRLINNSGFLAAERNLLQSHGWTYNPSTTMWHPPVGP